MIEITCPAKWVMAGEHSVLRGGTAVALPYPEYSLTLKFNEGARDETPALVHGLLQEAKDLFEANGKSLALPKGSFSVVSTIPSGAGMGSSAALCVAFTKWLARYTSLPESEWALFATRLENRFHGKSSGMDVAAVLARGPIAFTMAEGARSIEAKRVPNVTFHDTGLRSATRDCIQQVQTLRESNAALALELDEKMSSAARLGLEGLVRQDMAKIAQAMNQAHDCFMGWGLVTPEILRQRQGLIDEGALAVKLTGAGNGGFLVALRG